METVGTVGALLRDARTEAGLSLAALAPVISREPNPFSIVVVIDSTLP